MVLQKRERCSVITVIILICHLLVLISPLLSSPARGEMVPPALCRGRSHQEGAEPKQKALHRSQLAPSSSAWCLVKSSSCSETAFCNVLSRPVYDNEPNYGYRASKDKKSFFSVQNKWVAQICRLISRMCTDGDGVSQRHFPISIIEYVTFNCHRPVTVQTWAPLLLMSA